MIECSLEGIDRRSPTEYPDKDYEANDFQILLHHDEQVAFHRTLTDFRFGHANPTGSIVRSRWRRHGRARGFERGTVRQILARIFHPDDYLQR